MVGPEEAWARLDEPWQRCLELAWASTGDGCLGIGSVVTDETGAIVATGRNRLMTTVAGDDVLAGTSLAHAEMNALAKLRWPGGTRAGWTIWTTLEPCLMCAGSIRLTGVGTVRYLAPDGIWEGQWRVPEVCAYADFEPASRWPTVVPRPLDPFVAFAALLPMHMSAFWLGPDAMPPPWVEWSRPVVDLACDLAASHELIDAAVADTPLAELLAQLWDRLVAAST